MRVRCNRKGGYGLKASAGDGRTKRVRIRYGTHEISEADAHIVDAALDAMDPRMRDAIVGGKNPDIEIDVGDDSPASPPADDDGGETMSAADKVELAKAAETHEALRELAEGEERKTVLAAIEKRAAQLDELTANG